MVPCCSASYYCNEDQGESTYSDKAFVGSTVLEVLVVIDWPWGFGENKTTPLMIWKQIRKKKREVKPHREGTEAQLHVASLA